MAVCLVCGRYDEIGLRDALSTGWVFIRCPECQRGTPFDIIAGHLIKRTPEQFIEGFCPDHWFRDSGICSYCRMKRIAHGIDAESKLQTPQYGTGGRGEGENGEEENWQTVTGGAGSAAKS